MDQSAAGIRNTRRTPSSLHHQSLDAMVWRCKNAAACPRTWWSMAGARSARFRYFLADEFDVGRGVSAMNSRTGDDMVPMVRYSTVGGRAAAGSRAGRLTTQRGSTRSRAHPQGRRRDREPLETGSAFYASLIASQWRRGYLKTRSVSCPAPPISTRVRREDMYVGVPA